MNDYLHEITAFPNSKHDDEVDSTAQALSWLKQPSSFTNAMGWVRLRLGLAASADGKSANAGGLPWHGRPSPAPAGNELTEIYRNAYEAALEGQGRSRCARCDKEMVPGATRVTDGIDVWHPVSR